jgi:ribosomal protein L22
MPNTEKPTTKQESKKQGTIKPSKQKIEPVIQKEESKEKLEEKKVSEEKPKEVPENKEKKQIKKAPKKIEVSVNCTALPISTKYAMALCKFIKHKKIGQAISDLEKVITIKKVVPMKGEIPHRKGKVMSGRYPVRASKYFIKTLKGLQGNANNHGLEEPIIVAAIANIAERPYGRRGSVRKKRTHLKIIARERLQKNKGDKK